MLLESNYAVIAELEQPLELNTDFRIIVPKGTVAIADVTPAVNNE